MKEFLTPDMSNNMEYKLEHRNAYCIHQSSLNSTLHPDQLFIAQLFLLHCKQVGKIRSQIDVNS